VLEFLRSAHWKADPEGSCEGCHGPGGDHAEEADPTRIGRFGPEIPAMVRSNACLECHGRDRAQSRFVSSDHALASVACDDCHDPHGSSREFLLRKPALELCYGCHPTVRAAFSLNERHPGSRGGVVCSDCHDPHRRSGRTVLGGFKQQVCLKCHTEYRGPWVFEHEAVAAEGCGSCHLPHGSVNRYLLTYPRVSDLCLQCHPEQPFFHDLTDVGGSRTTSFNDCTACHAMIHGSNNDALFLN